MTPQRFPRRGMTGSIRIAPALPPKRANVSPETRPPTSSCVSRSSDSPSSGSRAAIYSAGMVHPICFATFVVVLVRCFRSLHHQWVTVLVPNERIFGGSFGSRALRGGANLLQIPGPQSVICKRALDPEKTLTCSCAFLTATFKRDTDRLKNRNSKSATSPPFAG